MTKLLSYDEHLNYCRCIILGFSDQTAYFGELMCPKKGIMSIPFDVLFMQKMAQLLLELLLLEGLVLAL